MPTDNRRRPKNSDASDADNSGMRPKSSDASDADDRRRRPYNSGPQKTVGFFYGGVADAYGRFSHAFGPPERWRQQPPSRIFPRKNIRSSKRAPFKWTSYNVGLRIFKFPKAPFSAGLTGRGSIVYRPPRGVSA